MLVGGGGVGGPGRASAEDEATPISNPVARATSANADSIPFFIREPLLSRLCVL